MKGYLPTQKGISGDMALAFFLWKRMLFVVVISLSSIVIEDDERTPKSRFDDAVNELYRYKASNASTARVAAGGNIAVRQNAIVFFEEQFDRGCFFSVSPKRDEI
jgi:hypothetical protein